MVGEAGDLGKLVVEQRPPQFVAVLQAKIGEKIAALQIGDQRCELQNEHLDRGDRQQIVFGRLDDVLFELGVDALLARVQYDPVQRVEQLGVGRVQFVVELIFAVQQGGGAVDDVRQRGLYELPSEAREKGGRVSAGRAAWRARARPTR